MNENTNEDEFKLDPELQAVEANLRTLKPRKAKIDFPPTNPTVEVARSRFWTYAATWTSGVVVGCLFMIAFRPSVPPRDRGQSDIANRGTNEDKHQGDSTPKLARTNETTTRPNPRSERAAAQIAKIVEGARQGRLLLGSHLPTSITETSHLRNTTFVSDDVVPIGADETSKPKSRRQMMSELLNGQIL